ncbi:MAG: cytochrome P450 [Myxococcales bacterium]|nr:cytochrome P450 [Myxococcales bacterium]
MLLWTQQFYAWWAMSADPSAATRRDPSRWTEPDRFDPERFGTDRNEGKKSGGAYMPFGAGAHSCVGAQLVIKMRTLLVESASSM